MGVDDIFAVVQKQAAEYRALTEAYDAELLKAHNCGHGSPEMDEHLSRAKAIGADVMEALKRYQEAVEELAARFAGIDAGACHVCRKTQPMQRIIAAQPSV